MPDRKRQKVAPLEIHAPTTSECQEFPSCKFCPDRIWMHREHASASVGQTTPGPAQKANVSSRFCCSRVGKQVQIITAIHVKAADPRGGVTSPNHLCQRPHLLHLGGHSAGVWEPLSAGSRLLIAHWVGKPLGEQGWALWSLLVDLQFLHCERQPQW